MRNYGLTNSSSAQLSLFAPAFRGRVVVVDDDEAMRELVEEMLIHEGFSVATYACGEDALGHQAPFELLVTDVDLPGLSGPALAREIRRRAPALPVLLVSGGTDPSRTDRSLPHAFLRKPFSSRALVSSVERLLPA